MDELMISGRRYLSSLRAAKEHGYHSDYIGQLIRGNKVKGQKVGRAWYVDAESLTTYLGKTAASPPEPPSESPAVVLIEEKEAEEKEIVEEIKKEEDQEEHHIPIVKVPEALEPTIRISIPDKPRRSEEVGVPTRASGKTGLTYIFDDSPLLPEIRKGQKLSRPPEPLMKDVAAKATSTQPKHSPNKKQSRVLEGLTLAGVGVFVLVVATAVSALFVSQRSVGPTQTASIYFSLPW